MSAINAGTGVDVVDNAIATHNFDKLRLSTNAKTARAATTTTALTLTNSNGTDALDYLPALVLTLARAQFNPTCDGLSYLSDVPGPAAVARRLELLLSKTADTIGAGGNDLATIFGASNGAAATAASEEELRRVVLRRAQAAALADKRE